MLISIDYGEPVTVKRITRDADTDTGVDLPAVPKSVFGRPSVSEDDDMRGRRSVLERNWFCPDDANVQVGDRITRSNGEVYSLLSDGMGDGVHPFTGDRFGVKRYMVRRVHTPRG